MAVKPLEAPFPWFGGKRKVAGIVWEHFGPGVRNYVEPFFGSGAVLLGRPGPGYGVETINDLDGFVANFWRAIKHKPKKTAEYADNPVNENDLHARHAWLVGQRKDLQAKLEGDPEYCDPLIAGWWVWGICSWIGGGFCDGTGPWHVEDGKLVASESRPGGVNRKLVHLGDAGRGINRQLVHLRTGGMGVNRPGKSGLISDWFKSLANRLRDVRVCSGDWSRVCGPSPTFKLGTTAVFLDPPYADTADRCSEIYAVEDLQVAHAVRDWAIGVGDNPSMRIALCGYEGEHAMPDSWSVVEWKAHGGYGTIADEEDRTNNNRRERIWFSPNCLGARQARMF